MPRCKWERIDCAYYDARYYVCCGGNKQDALKRFCKETKNNIVDEDVSNAIAFVAGSGKDLLIYLPKIPKTISDSSLVVHEVFHAATDVLLYSGVSIKYGDANEAFAYYVAWLFGEVMKRIK